MDCDVWVLMLLHQALGFTSVYANALDFKTHSLLTSCEELLPVLKIKIVGTIV